MLQSQKKEVMQGEAESIVQSIDSYEVLSVCLKFVHSIQTSFF